MIKLIDDDNEKISAIQLTKADEARILKNSIKGKDELPASEAAKAAVEVAAPAPV